MGWFASRAPFGNKRMRERFLAELRLKPHVGRVPESLLIIQCDLRSRI